MLQIIYFQKILEGLCLNKTGLTAPLYILLDPPIKTTQIKTTFQKNTVSDHFCEIDWINKISLGSYCQTEELQCSKKHRMF